MQTWMMIKCNTDEEKKQNQYVTRSPNTADVENTCSLVVFCFELDPGLNLLYTPLQ